VSLSSTARAVLSNFIVFATIIGLVLRQLVHPKALLEKEQTIIENQIKESEVVKEESEVRLSSIEASMANIEKEIDAILVSSEENAKLVGEKIVQDGSKTALTIKENTEKALENSKTILKNDLLKRTSLASVEIAKLQIINELNNNQELHNKLIEESIEALEGVNQ
jgi:F0F1-type ATP synthase membrane subunit b/b'